ncbi:hypothetical protein [Paenibacillus sp. GXUN7292]|uniref:hypothetical protein n=1 Tax=Paenibacillus sp. GXUN7292 TaxID=3422499 RepID=UPI003D7E2F49
MKTYYKEIFLITRIKDNVYIYIPLKQSLFISELILYSEAFLEFYGDTVKQISTSDFYLQFFEFLKKNGFVDLKMRIENVETELFYSNYSIVVDSNEEEIRIRDWNDRVFSSNIKDFENNLD